MKTNILGVLFDNNTSDKTAELALEKISKNEKFVIFTPNPEIVMLAKEDTDYMTVLNSADVVTPDGIGIVYASKILGGFIKKRAAGFDIVCKLLQGLSDAEGSVYLFGGKPGVAEKAQLLLTEKYPGLQIVGTHDGYFENDLEIICDINEKCPDLLLVCLGAPKQEKWIYLNKDKLNAKVMIGAGGSIDILAENVKRAPDIFIKFGCEWLYRLICQPSRFGRMMKLPLFLLTVIFKGNRSKKNM